MNQDLKSIPRLADIEQEVIAEAREWGRQRLEERLRQLASQAGEVFPLKQRKRRGLKLQSELGEIKLVVDYGQDPRSGQWGCALARHWGLAPHQKITPGFADKLCFTATATGSYEEAAQVASRWTQRMVSRSTVHQLAQRLGALAEQQTQQRVATVPAEELPQRAASQLAVLMVDGWMVRQRGPGWAQENRTKPGGMA